MKKATRNPLITNHKGLDLIQSVDHCSLANAIEEELRRKPKFFMPFGAIGKTDLAKALSQYDFLFPQELVNLWIKFGGGEFWETENILHPLPTDDESLEDMVSYNKFAYETGFDRAFHIFASNTVELVAFHKVNHSIKIFRPKEEHYREDGQFDNILEWFNSIFQDQYDSLAITIAGFEP